MAAFGSFDPELRKKELRKYQERYGADNVMLVKRSKLFVWLNIALPIICYLLIYAGIMVAVSLNVRNDQTIGYVAIIGLLAVVLAFLSMHFKRLLDYYLDFIIITPKQVVSFNQQGIWRRDNRTIETEKIKSISAKYRNCVFSLFNNGDITFLSEGDAQNGEINAYYVHSPQKTKEAVYKIIEVTQKHGHAYTSTTPPTTP
jgi:uncharacterized membrane protein YdbT with pleckstrin-like domain